MLNLAQLREDRALVGRIDWEITPRQAFEGYQLRGPGNWRDRGLDPVVYFYLAVWKDEPRLLLVERTYRDSRELAEVEAPADLVEACLAQQEGEPMPTGHYQLCPELKAWLQERLGV